MKDVAALAGVSTATVSRLLSGDAHVSSTARQRVEAAIAQLNYTPNAISRALRTQTSRSVALLVADIENPFLTSVVHGVESVLRSAGYSLLLFNSDEDPDLELENLRVAQQARPAGLIITPIGRELDLSAYQGAGTAIVAVDRPITTMAVDTVLVETRTASRRAVEHLHERGAHRVALVTGPRGTHTADERFRGWRDALSADELAAQDELARFTSFNVDGGEAATRALVRQQPRPDGVLVANSLLAIGALRALRQAGLIIGQDVLFAAFDDAPWTGLLSNNLDLIRQPAVDVGHAAAELLVARLENPSSDPEQVLLHPTLSFSDDPTAALLAR